MDTQPRQLQVGVKIALQNPDGKYLLVRRNPLKYPEIGPKWDIVGGRINISFPLMENLKREVLEETGLSFDGVAALFAAQDILRVPGRHVVRLTYAGKIDGTPVIDEESLEYGWFTATELKEMSEETLDMYFKEVIETTKILE